MAQTEFELIARYFAPLAPPSAPGLVLGIGDDAALLQPDSDREIAVAVDTLVADVHFPADLPAGDLAWRSLAVNLSDLAAMGARPRWFTLSLTLPEVSEAWLAAFAAGLADLAARERCLLVGGDTTRGPLSVTVTILGDVPAGRALRRAGAREGDRVLVSGQPGFGAPGLADWRGGRRDSPAACRFRRPQPRTALGQALAGIATAAIDVSDGLWADLGHVLTASGVGARLDPGAIDGLAARLDTEPAAARDALLHGGDDYELCFTAPVAARKPLQALAAELDLPLHDIGVVVAGNALALPGHVPPDGGGYRHF
jgi:thiamine-monophosphate kinase